MQRQNFVVIGSDLRAREINLLAVPRDTSDDERAGDFLLVGAGGVATIGNDIDSDVLILHAAILSFAIHSHHQGRSVSYGVQRRLQPRATYSAASVLHGSSGM